jgi:hypothetical protein
MSPNLSERYNDGVVPRPDLSADVPPLHRPTHRLTLEQETHARSQMVVAIIVLLVLILACLFLAVWLVPLVWTVYT